MKQATKKFLKKVLQPFLLSEKDQGKKVYYDALKKPVRDDFIFYEAFAGLGILDHPRAIFKATLSDSSFTGYTHIWAIDDLDLAKSNTDEFSSLSNVILVKRGSFEYYRYLATCKYLISNTTFGYYFVKRPQQIYVNTWHGVPTKYMGYEHALERVENARGPARHFLSADYLLSANRFMTDVMYRRAYMCDGLFRGNLLEIGSPRCDFLVHPDTEYVKNRLSDAGILTDKKIILYAPTWKGSLYDALEYDLDEFKSFVKRLSDTVDADEYRICLRVHYFLYRRLANDPAFKELLIPFTIDTNELLSIVDVLISDYSSIFFDYLLTEKPMIFYVPDLKEYEQGRGLYVPVENLPGLVSFDISDICNALSSIAENEDAYRKLYKNQYDTLRKWCTYNEDGNACQRLIDIVFKGEKISASKPLPDCDFSKIDFNRYEMDSHSYCRFDGFATNKEKVLVLFNTRTNDEDDYQKLLDYLKEFDFDTKDLTLLIPSFKDKKNKQFFNTLPYNIRILVNFPLPFVTKENENFWTEEVLRLFGNATFDSVSIIGTTTIYQEHIAKAITRK